MTQSYVFEVTLEDSGDEFSEQFNPNNEDDVLAFEKDIEQLFEIGHWDSTVRLKRVIVDL